MPSPRAPPRPAALLAAILLLAAALPPAAATAQLFDAYEYDEPLARAVMECSDMISPAIGEASGKDLYLELARACVEEPALLLTEGHSARVALATAHKCFSRTLFPRAARGHSVRLLRCVDDLLIDADS